MRNSASYALVAAARTGTPVLVWGPPGIGKTAAIQMQARKMGLHLETLVLSHRMPDDLLGIQIPALNETPPRLQLATPTWAERLTQAGARAALFLDELSCAPHSMQQAALRLVHERVAGEVTLPPHMPIVAAANPADVAAGGFDLTAPLANRFRHIHIDVDVADWVREFPGYWGAPPNLGPAAVPEEAWAPWRARIDAVIHRRPELLLKMPESDTARGQAWPSPRSWDHASRALAAEGLSVDALAE